MQCTTDFHINVSVVHGMGAILNSQKEQDMFCLKSATPASVQRPYPRKLCLPLCVNPEKPHWLLLVVDTNDGSVAVYCSLKRNKGKPVSRILGFCKQGGRHLAWYMLPRDRKY